MIQRYETVLVLIFAICISIISIVHYYHQGTILAYGDAESHLNIPKRVVGGVTKGFGHLGGNWLPLQHIITIPFVAIDTLY